MSPSTPDAPLVALARSGNLRAYARLVDRNVGIAWTAAYAASGDPVQSDIRVRTAVLEGALRLTELTPDTGFGAWLRGRVAAKQARWADAWRSMAGTSTAPWAGGCHDAHGCAREHQHWLTSAYLCTVPGRCRETVLLHYREALSVASICRVLGLRERVVVRRLLRCQSGVTPEIADLLRDSAGVLGPRSNGVGARELAAGSGDHWPLHSSRRPTFH